MHLPRLLGADRGTEGKESHLAIKMPFKNYAVYVQDLVFKELQKSCRI